MKANKMATVAVLSPHENVTFCVLAHARYYTTAHVKNRKYFPSVCFDAYYWYITTRKVITTPS